LAPLRADDLAALPIRALMERHHGADWGAVDDVILGCANQAGEDNRNIGRMAALLAGLPVEVAGTTINRLCGSSLDAITMGARAIKSGEADLVIAGGIEHMTRAPLVLAKASSAFSRNVQFEDSTIGWRFVNPTMREQFGIDSMPETAQNLADEFAITRADQDAFAFRSQQRWAAAEARGFFAGELIPVHVPTGKRGTVSFLRDEHPRADTTLDDLAKLKSIVRATGSITAGNASGVNDGASAVLLASSSALSRHGLQPRALILGAAVAGVAPRIMGIGPVPATRKLLGRLGLGMSDFSVVEINEAFAAQALAVTRQLGLPDDAPQVNPNGGAIAIGHPLGASGARLVATALNQLEGTDGRRALCTMCIGVGQGIALALERIR
jgi:acetyl-CoA acyltransferase